MQLPSEVKLRIEQFLGSVGFQASDIIQANAFAYDLDGAIDRRSSSAKALVGIGGIKPLSLAGNGEHLYQYEISLHLICPRTANSVVVFDLAAQVIEALLTAQTGFPGKPGYLMKPYARLADFDVPGFDSVTLEFELIVSFSANVNRTFPFTNYEISV